MRYGLLGPLEVVGDDGQSVALSGDRERVLVAVLLLGANRVVPTSRLTDALWGDQPPSTAGNALQVHVSRLRKKLAAGSAGGDLLRRESSGYRLTVAAGELDMQRFEDLVGPASPHGRYGPRLRGAAPPDPRVLRDGCAPLDRSPPARFGAQEVDRRALDFAAADPDHRGPASRRPRNSRSFAAQDPKILPGDRNFLLDSTRGERCRTGLSNSSKRGAGRR